jgi:hypothetical protein
MAKIFISYRREDTAATAGRLYDRLLTRYGKDQLFMDVDTIEPGERFSDVVQRTVGSCDILLALVGDRWLNAKDSTGQTRLSNPDDWVRLEVATALKRDVRVIPVLINGAIVPRRSDLPEDLYDLAMRQAIDVTHAHFHADVDRLLQALDKVLSRPSTASSPAETAGAISSPKKAPVNSWPSSSAVPATEKPPEEVAAPWTKEDKKLLALKVAVAVVNIPFATLTIPSFFPHWLQDFGSGDAMVRLGVCFGLVLVVWNARVWQDLRKPKNLLFLAASVGSAVAAGWFGNRVSSVRIWGIVITGAVCLALAQRLLFRSRWIQAISAAILAPAAFYLLWLSVDKLFSREIFSPAGYTPLYWQLGFLLGIYGTAQLKIKPFWKNL